jgi:signal transduction histidine kinase
VGLGLAICHKIVREHGGLLRVKSVSGQGSVFFIRLNARS